MTKTDAQSIASFATCSFDEIAAAYNGAQYALEYMDDRAQWRKQYQWFLLIDAIGKFRFDEQWPPEN